ncbi:MAG: hypothetical protein ACJ8MR_18840 [Povalibacter sp.]
MLNRFRSKLATLAQTSWVLYAVRETAIVTVGILIAFGLNAWWENHKESREEGKHLRTLASDFGQNATRLKELINLEGQIQAASLSLIRSDREMDTAALRTALGRVFSSDRFEPVMGAYEGLVSSTGLTLVSDEQLRGDLASFAAAVESPYGERLSNDLYFEFTREFIGKLQYANSVAGLPTSEPGYRELLSDPRFREHLALRYAAERDVERHYRHLLDLCERINARL